MQVDQEWAISVTAGRLAGKQTTRHADCLLPRSLMVVVYNGHVTPLCDAAAFRSRSS